MCRDDSVPFLQNCVRLFAYHSCTDSSKSGILQRWRYCQSGVGRGCRCANSKATCHIVSKLKRQLTRAHDARPHERVLLTMLRKCKKRRKPRC